MAAYNARRDFWLCALLVVPIATAVFGLFWIATA